ncbi:ABC transporter permease [Longimycelium tulufanense]|uniref:ABC transporter permease n=1 Tax=Longimycelium tulufanense TaxID=907463 RepID=A0A8J3CFS8_9PSEU|nr:ABC-2 family transporter protein [Longimycelium tulufanense]GGM59119.1 ABC transporter permease [Longimycelium tulufanense]
MASTVRAYRRVIGSRLRAQATYRLSFTVELCAQVIAGGLELVTILAVFHNTTSLGGFGRNDVLLMYGLATFGFGLADLAVSQLNHLGELIRTGKFDVLLVRPLGTLGQVLTLDVQLRRLGRAAIGFATLLFALSVADISWSMAKLALLVVAPLAGAVIFSSVWVAACSICFWLVDGREFANSVTYGSSMFNSYPINIFSAWLRRLMAFVVPGAFVAYYPALVLLERTDPLGLPGWLGWTSPLVAVAATAVAGGVWRFAVRHYRGTGS